MVDEEVFEEWEADFIFEDGSYHISPVCDSRDGALSHWPEGADLDELRFRTVSVSSWKASD